jgi:flagellar biosynthesis GTPase FlhF
LVVVQYPSTPLYNISSRPKCAKELNSVVTDQMKHNRNEHIMLYEGFSTRFKDELTMNEPYKSSSLRLFVWCAEGADELKQKSDDSEENRIIKFIISKKPDTILLCFKYGVDYMGGVFLEKFRKLGLVCNILCWKLDIFSSTKKILSAMVKDEILCVIDKVLADGPESVAADDGEKHSHISNISCSLSSHTPNNKKVRESKQELVPRIRKGVECKIEQSVTKDWFNKSKKLQKNSLKMKNMKHLATLREMVTNHINQDDNLYISVGCDHSQNDARALALHLCNDIVEYSINETDNDNFGVYHVARDGDIRKLLSEIHEKPKNGGVEENYALIWVDYCPSIQTKTIFKEYLQNDKLDGVVLVLLLIRTGHGGEDGFTSMLKQNNFIIKKVEVDANNDNPGSFQVEYSELRGTFRMNLATTTTSNHQENQECPPFFCLNKTTSKYLKREINNLMIPKNAGGDDLSSLVNIYHDVSTIFISFSVMTIQQLKLLLQNVLFYTGEDVMAEKLGIPVDSFGFDHPSLIEMFESLVLKLNTLTEEQQIAVKKIKDAKRRLIHIVGPAGTGKTFVSTQYIVDHTNDDDKILFVGETETLAFHVARWICNRVSTGDHAKILARIQFLCVGQFDGVPMRITICDNGNLVAEHVGNSTVTMTEFELIVVDEAHNVFLSKHKFVLNQILRVCKWEEDYGQEAEILNNEDLPKLILLYDASQASVNYLDIKYLDNYAAVEIELKNITRTSRHITARASTYQQFDYATDLHVGHEFDGPPIQSYFFDPKSEDNLMQKYAQTIMKAVNDLKESFFSNINLHHRLAILVPDEDFLTKLESELKKPFEDSKLRAIRAIASTKSLNLSKISKDHSNIIIDTVEKMSGLETMIVFGVGLDNPISNEHDLDDFIHNRTKAILYKAMTRAHLSFFFINERVEGRWVELHQERSKKETLKNDKDVGMKAVLSMGQAIKYASKELQKDKDILAARKSQ